MVFETLNAVSSLKINESKSDGLLRLSGVFGVAGVKNANNRIYDKDNYNNMVEALQKEITEAGCPGELEHPNSMNIDLHNVSHKIESIQMNEDGTITGTICLLNTPNGKIAQSIVEGGLPLYISSRGAGSVTNEGKVTLSTIKTYDLVGTPGFSQAQLNLDKNQKFENLNESLDDANTNCWAIITESDDVLDDDEPTDKKIKPKKTADDEPAKDDEPADNEPKEKENNKDTNNKVNMEDLKKSIDALTEKVNQLEAGLHVAQESLDNIDSIQDTITETQNVLDSIKPVNYDAIQKWITEEFGPEFKHEVSDELTESIANGVQDWTINEFAPSIQKWITEEYSPEVQAWVCEEYSEQIQGWITEEFAPEVQNWMTDEYAPAVENWLHEELLPENNRILSESINSNVSEFLESQNETRLENIDNMLESLESNTNQEVQNIIAEQHAVDKYANIYAVTHMPNEYQPSWNLLSESRKDEIIQSTKAYDFTKRNVLENFWANVDFNQVKINEVKEVPANPIANKLNVIAESMKSLRPKY